MSSGPGPTLRVALVHHALGDPSTAATERVVWELAAGLSRIGHEPEVLTCHRGPGSSSIERGIRVVRVRRLPETPLRVRGFATPITQVPFAVSALRSGGYDVAHAFSVIDAKAGSIWARLGGGPVVFSCCEPVARERLADKRHRLRMSVDAFARSAAVTAVDEDVRASIERWLAQDVPVIDPADARAHAVLYRRLVRN